MICNKCNHKLPDDSEFCQYCGVKLENRIDLKEKMENNHNIYKSEIKNTPKIANNEQSSMFIKVINIVSIIASIIAIIAIIFAVILQDSNRNVQEDINTTLLYLLLCVLYVVYCILMIFAWQRPDNKRLYLFSVVLPVASLLTLLEGSLFSNRYFAVEKYHSYIYYINHNYVSICNTIWVIISYVIFILGLLVWLDDLFKIIKVAWYSSVRYRERRYKKVAKIYNYYTSGIITQEEYEKLKKKILKNINT